jgi:hypothetical protein
MIRNYFHITIDANGRNAKVLGMLDRDKLVDNTIWDIYHYIHGGPDVLIEIQSADAPCTTNMVRIESNLPLGRWKIPVSEVNEECSDFLLPWIKTSRGRVGIAKAINKNDLTTLLKDPTSVLDIF